MNNPEAIKLSFLTYLGYVERYDYLGFGWFILTFLSLIILAIFVAKRSSVLSLLIIIFALVFCVVAPFVLKTKLSEWLRAVDVTMEAPKKLTFSEALIIDTSLHNRSDRAFSLCVLLLSIHKKSGDESFLSTLKTLKPIAHRSIVVQADIPPDETVQQRIVIEPYTYQGEIDAHIVVECY